MSCGREVHQGLYRMAKELPVIWSEIEKACLAGVPMNQVAKGIADKTEGITEKQLYTAIRKRASRERWPLPDAIIRRAKAAALVAAGVAGDAKDGAKWRKGESALHQVAQSREAVGMGVPRDFEEHEKQLPSRNAPDGEEGCGFGGVSGLTSAPPTAENLVTQDLVTLGNRGLRAILNRATQAAEAMVEAPEVRSWQDVQVMTKVISQAAGLDKPQVAIAVSLNSGTNSGIAGWESAESIDTIAERVG